MSNRKPVPEINDEEEARIQAGIALDHDNPEWTEEEFKNAKPFAEVFPEWAKKIAEGKAGGIEYVGVDIRVVERFKERGPDWRTQMNTILRKAVGL
jgi:uncharacterized protein (DUF4415 family)